MAFTAQQEEELKALAARQTRRMRDLPEQTEYDSDLFVRVLDEDNPDPSKRDRKINIDLAGIGNFSSGNVGDDAGVNRLQIPVGQISAIRLIRAGGNGIRFTFVGSKSLSNLTIRIYSFNLDSNVMSLVDTRIIASSIQAINYSLDIGSLQNGSPYAIIVNVNSAQIIDSSSTITLSRL